MSEPVSKKAGQLHCAPTSRTRNELVPLGWSSLPVTDRLGVGCDHAATAVVSWPMGVRSSSWLRRRCGLYQRSTDSRVAPANRSRLVRWCLSRSSHWRMAHLAWGDPGLFGESAPASHHAPRCPMGEHRPTAAGRQQRTDRGERADREGRQRRPNRADGQHRSH